MPLDWIWRGLILFLCSLIFRTWTEHCFKVWFLSGWICSWENGVFIQKNKITFMVLIFRSEDLTVELKDNDVHLVNAVLIQSYIMRRWTSYWSSLYPRSKQRKLGLTLLRYHFLHTPTDWVYPKIVQCFFGLKPKTSSYPKVVSIWRIVWQLNKHST